MESAFSVVGNKTHLTYRSKIANNRWMGRFYLICTRHAGCINC